VTSHAANDLQKSHHTNAQEAIAAIRNRVLTTAAFDTMEYHQSADLGGWAGVISCCSVRTQWP
jgi:hypothetical protein